MEVVTMRWSRGVPARRAEQLLQERRDDIRDVYAISTYAEEISEASIKPN